MGRRTTSFVERTRRARARGGAVDIGCGLWLLLAVPALAAEDPAPVATQPEFADRLHGPAWTAAMQSAGVLSNGPPFVASPLERKPPPPASLFFNGRPIGDPVSPERFRQDTSSLESPVEPEAPAAAQAPPAAQEPAPPEESAAPTPRPITPPVAEDRPAHLSRPHRPTRHAAREPEPVETSPPPRPHHEIRRREKAAARPAAHTGVARAPEPAHVRQRQAAREPQPAAEPEPARRQGHPLLTGRSVASKPVPLVKPPLAARPLGARQKQPAAPVVRIAREPRVPVIALPSSLLPTQP